MTTPHQIESKIKSIKPYLKQEFGISHIGYFGSFARGDHHEKSDVDVIVKLSKKLGWKFFDLKYYLESVLERKVDLVTEPSLKKQWKDQILKDVRYI